MHYIMCIYVNLIYMFIPMVIIGNIHLFHDMEGDLKQICLYSGYEYLIAGGGDYLPRHFLWTWIYIIKKQNSSHNMSPFYNKYPYDMQSKGSFVKVWSVRVVLIPKKFQTLSNSIIGNILLSI